ncbi:MAG: hypothetical protein LBC18_00310 [Opitutaceae bacterium]|jgi:hypothetical protein|nr:hypothetical protein [Opitutaceae bacterium]
MSVDKFAASFYATAANAGLWVIPRAKCRELLACLLAFGGGDSQWTMTVLAHKCLFAQKMLRIEGGEAPAMEDAVEIARLVRELLPLGLIGKPAKPLPAWAEKILRENGVKTPA